MTKVLQNNNNISIEEAEMFVNIFRRNPDGIGITKMLDGTIVKINEGFRKMFGYKEEELIGKTTVEVNIYSKEARNKMVYALKKNGRLENLEYELNHKSGRKIIGLIFIEIVKTRNETYLIFTVRDITERVRQDKELKESEARFKTIFENVPDAMYLNDLYGNLIYGNLAAEKLIGVPREELIGKNVFEKILVPEDTDKAIKALEQNAKGLKSGPDEYIINTQEGKKIVEVTGFPFKINNEITVLGIAHDISEQKEKENELRERDSIIRSIIETSKDWIWAIDLDGVHTYSNNAVENILGYSAAELKGLQSIQLIYEEDRDKVNILLSECVTGKKGWKNNVIRWKHKNGNMKYLESSSVPILDEKNNVVGFRGVDRDITEREKFEKELIKAKEQAEENEQKLLISQRAANIGLYELDVKKGIYRGSDESKRILGFDPDTESISIEQVWSLFADYEKTSRILKNAWQNMDSHDTEIDIYRYNTKEKRTLSISSKIQRDNFGNAEKVLGLLKDITDKKRTEQELISAKERAEANEKKLMISQELAKLGGWELDYETEIFTFTDNFYKIYHTSAEEMGGYQVPLEEFSEKFVHPDDISWVVEESMKAIETNDSNFRNYIEHRIKYFDGGVGYIGVRSEVVKDKNGKTIKVYGVNQDITEKKNAEIELIKAKEKAEESDRLKSAFLANMSHEIRTPMNGIHGFAELLQDPDLNKDTQIKFLKLILQSSERLTNTITDIVELSKIEADQMPVILKEVNIKDVLQFHYDFFNLEAQNKGIAMELERNNFTENLLIYTDIIKFEAILTNLLKNAIKYTDTGSIKFGYNVEGKKIRFYVKDTGIGIPSDKTEIIFERFVQADMSNSSNYEGSGLGLAISKSYVKMLGGEIWVESVNDQGSTFYFTIDLKKVEKVPAQTKNTNDSKTNIPKQKYKVLIADDENVNCLLLQYILADFNFKIHCVSTGKQAVEYMKKNGDEISLILMDLKMPDMDGFEATKKIREFKSEVPIIAQTAHALSGDKEKVLDAGFNDYISKPISKTRLIQVIKKYL